MGQGSEGGSDGLKLSPPLPALAILVLFVLCLWGLNAVATQAEEPAIPAYDGDMTFRMIHGPEDPEEFSWQVMLNGDQELEAIDDQHVEIYYTEGHHPALEISAEAAHDADGSDVPTTLSVSGDSIITLTVHHRDGDPNKGGSPFAYPILAGPGWEGGYQTFIVTGPPAEQDPSGQARTQAPSLVKTRKRKGAIGGRPSALISSPTQGRRTTPALVIGRGSLLGGPVEIVGAGWSAPRYFETPGDGQLCVWVELLAAQESSLTCGPVAETASDGKAVHIEAFREGGNSRGPREAEIAGSLSPDVASISVSFGRRGSPRIFHAKAVVARVSGDLQTSLKQPNPFGYFVSEVRGRFIARSLRIQAFDKEGHLVGISQGLSSEFLP